MLNPTKCLDLWRKSVFTLSAFFDAFLYFCLLFLLFSAISMPSFSIILKFLLYEKNFFLLGKMA